MLYLLVNVAILGLFQLCVADMLRGNEAKDAHETLMKHMSSTMESAKKPIESYPALSTEEKIDTLSSTAFGGYIVGYFTYSGTTCAVLEAAPVIPLGVCYLDSTSPNVYKIVTKTSEDNGGIYTSEVTYTSSTGSYILLIFGIFFQLTS